MIDKYTMLKQKIYRQVVKENDLRKMKIKNIEKSFMQLIVRVVGRLRFRFFFGKEYLIIENNTDFFLKC